VQRTVLEPPPCPHQLPLYVFSSTNVPVCCFAPAWQEEDSYGHLDFTWGVDACTRVYPPLLDLLRMYR
jgi:hypothetical protein